jgi:hypothetical protein
VLGLLEQGPVSSEMLNSELGLLLEGAQDQEVADLVCEIVTTLAKIGLVQSSEDAS